MPFKFNPLTGKLDLVNTPLASEGVPAGGDAGQILAKIDGTDYNTEWVTPSRGSGYFSKSGNDITLTD